MIIRRGDIYYADLRPVVGSEQGGVRPVLIIQNDVGNKHSPTVICAAITSKMNKAKLPTHVELSARPVSYTHLDVYKRQLLEHESDPVIWRGPVIAGAVKQFWNETYWKDIDYMFVDMPPGTGDVPLTVFQSLPVDGICLLYTSA